ncbi:NAD(P)(+) transhydrogenase (AB-specific) [Chthoniobacter flavus Ellin428]|uniref:proton-translocating NAD(P)(+) transhydrogenase n=1 Tax=Chthoniobacter flavus Ellin428 TaxID=497964 RepID=B4CXA0_9BACT|nr:NAD(P)(+) transhydrogenase (Re/Si-specific) subunit alpha [Chthoniobacter flavus]EDY20898.1 NAD(P)(+) transhydrogenase (AB-specific) [Chthoniobacter flavus Ellin428]TCO88632.1 NAD(P) transhydrogenase subunit alpha [Chthoniobacter flavus]
MTTTVAVPKETQAGETRVALIPEHVAKLVKLGACVEVELGAGLGSGHRDEAYTAAGATVVADRAKLLAAADIVVTVRKLSGEEVATLRRGTVLAGLLDPFLSPALITKLSASGVSAISMELIPRSTRAQKMDVLSSQASLAGYAAVIIAAEQSDKIFPMMMTPAGTIMPARVFIIGAGVAGLQAIATAKRLGAKVEAYDTRPVTEEQVRSLGARFLKIDLGETGQTAQGYANVLTEEQLKLQRAAMKRVCAESDIVITTAQVFGRRAPILVTSEMLDAMRPGSVVVDLAVENGGNVEGVEAGRIADRRGVKIVGLPNLPACVPVHASQMYSANVTALLEEFWDREAKVLRLNFDDEIIKGCVVTHGGKIVNEKLASLATS